MKEGRKSEYPEKTSDELQKPSTTKEGKDRYTKREVERKRHRRLYLCKQQHLLFSPVRKMDVDAWEEELQKEIGVTR